MTDTAITNAVSSDARHAAHTAYVALAAAFDEARDAAYTAYIAWAAADDDARDAAYVVASADASDARHAAYVAAFDEARDAAHTAYVVASAVSSDARHAAHTAYVAWAAAIDTTTTTGEAKADAAERLHEATRQVQLARAHEQAAIKAFDAASYAHWKTVEYPAWLAAKG